MSQIALTAGDARDPAAERVISEGLRRYNEAQSGIADRRPLHVVARDPATKAPLGGITGRTALGVPGFCERHGYQVFGSIPCNPPGASRIVLARPLR